MYFAEPVEKKVDDTPQDDTRTTTRSSAPGPSFEEQSLALSPKHLVEEGMRARRQLEELDSVCPEHDPPSELLGLVRWQVETCLDAIEKAKGTLNPRSIEQDRATMRDLRYTRKWSFPSYVRAERPDGFEALVSALDKASSSDSTRGAPLDEKALLTLRGQVERCLALHKVGGKTEQQKAKQINTANAKMVSALQSALELELEDKAFFEDALRRIQRRIAAAAESNGADFKSCDSAGIDLETQLQRAEAKCHE